MAMRRLMALLLVLMLGFTLILSGCSSSPSELTRVRLCEVTHSIFYAPQYVALHQGFFEDVGLEIELSNGQGADKVMTAVLTNQADIGLAGPEACVYVYNEGKEDYAVVFAQLTNGDGTFLMGREPDPDFQWSDLKARPLSEGVKAGCPRSSWSMF